MNLETLRNNDKKILFCHEKDESGLNDYQKMPDQSKLAIDEVGIERFRLPIQIKHENDIIMSHDATASMKIYLQDGKTGANMSRFCQILQDAVGKTPVSNDFYEKTLYEFRIKLRDYDYEDPIDRAILSLKFDYPMKQKALKSPNWGWQYYPCLVQGTQEKDNTTLMSLTLTYEYSSTCPCSLSMAKQYEKDFALNLTEEGNGIAVAHGQRSVATVTVKYNSTTDFWIEDLVSHLQKALPTETQSLVKRIDEQAFAILNGENPMFVEHATRRISFVLDQDERILDWEAKVEHLESLHSHNAVAKISKNHKNKCLS